MTDAEADGWREMLENGHPRIRFWQTVLRHVPSAPRCKFCYLPFGGVGGRVCSTFGYRRSRKNPQMCVSCCEHLPPGGAEIDIAVLFADIRGSSRLARQDGPARFAQRLKRFYVDATNILVRHDAMIDKMIGDEAMAVFMPGMAGPGFRQKAIDAALALAALFDARNRDGIALGIAVHGGRAYVGNVATDFGSDLTALGETVHFAAHLQAAAGPGEVLVTAALAAALPALPMGFVAHDVTLKNESEPVSVLSYTHGPRTPED